VLNAMYPKHVCMQVSFCMLSSIINILSTHIIILLQYCSQIINYASCKKGLFNHIKEYNHLSKFKQHEGQLYVSPSMTDFHIND